MKYACPAEREQLAYLAQEKWLSLFGKNLADEFEPRRLHAEDQHILRFLERASRQTMSAASFSGEMAMLAFTAINSVRVIAYVPQILRVARDIAGAEAISCATWIMFALSHLSTVAYAMLTVEDIRDGDRVHRQFRRVRADPRPHDL